MVIVRGLSSRAGTFLLHDVSFQLASGAWGIVLGQTGSGKTTLLETIAGVRRAIAGQIVLRDEDVTSHPIEQRRVSIVYQHSYLFPHLTVDENVGYGTMDTRFVSDLGSRFGVDGLRGRPVASLSGGERQLVALVRALARHPDILLLDEPFAALDPRRRIQVRRQLRLMQRESGMTVLHVTHDFAEAGTLGDLAIVLEAGRVIQIGTPTEVFRRPASGSVAEFLGAENVFSGTIQRTATPTSGETDVLHFTGEGIALVGVGEHAGGAGHAVIRGSDVVLAHARSARTSARNVLDGVVEEVLFDGMIARVAIRVGSTMLVAVVTRSAVDDLGFAPGLAVVASIKAIAVHLC